MGKTKTSPNCLPGAASRGIFTEKVEGITLVRPDDPGYIGSAAHISRLGGYARSRTKRHDVTVKLSGACMRCKHSLDDHPDGGGCQSDGCQECKSYIPGGRSYTDMKGNLTVWSDTPPDGSIGEREVCILGALRHEICHELYTDPVAFEQFTAKLGKMQAAGNSYTSSQRMKLWNILEDGMIEQRERNEQPGAYRIIAARNKIAPKMGHVLATEEERIFKLWPGHTPTDDDGNLLPTEERNGQQVVVVPAGTKIGTWSENPINPSMQMESALMASALPEYEPGDLHPEVRACLDECQPHIDAAVTGNSSDCILRSEKVFDILVDHGFQISEEEEQDIRQMQAQMGNQPTDAPESSGAEGEAAPPQNGDPGQEEGEGGSPGEGDDGSSGDSGSDDGGGSDSGMTDEITDDKGGGGGSSSKPDPKQAPQSGGGGGSGGEDSSAGEEGDEQSGGGDGSGSDEDGEGEAGDGGDDSGDSGGSDSAAGGGSRTNNPLSKEKMEANEKEGKGSVTQEEAEKMKKDAERQLESERAEKISSDNQAATNGRIESNQYKFSDNSSAVPQAEAIAKALQRPTPLEEEKGDFFRQGDRIAREVEALRSATVATKTRRMSGRIDMRQISRGLAGDPRIHTRKGRKFEMELEIDISLDRSGSITDEVASQQYRAAMAIAHACEKADIPLTISGWHGSDGHCEHIALKEKHSDDKRGIAALFSFGGSGTPMAEAIQFSRRRLANSKASNKINILCTDGLASTAEGRKRAKEELKAAQRDGIDLIALGYQLDEEVMKEQFGSTSWKSIKSFDETYDVVAAIIREAAQRASAGQN